MKIFFASRVRGFFRQLFSSELLNAEFVYDESNVYETNNWINKIKVAIGGSFIFDLLGVVQVINCKREDCEIIGSFNRFLNTNLPYFIFVENPTALYHYRLFRNKFYIGKRKVQKELRNPNLKGLVFMSRACGSTFEDVCGKIPKNCIAKTIYPLVPSNPNVNPEQIKTKSYSQELKLLYIAQGIRFKSKGGLEILEAFQKLRRKGLKVQLHVITSLNDISSKLIDELNLIEGVTLNDFEFSFKDLQRIYADSHILLQPTSDDSFNLTVLEAIKSGLPIIASRLYAIPEMVEEGVNGYLCDPHFWFFDERNIPNPKVWNNRNRTIYSGKISEEIVHFLEERISYLYSNRNILEEMSYNSLKKSFSAPFSEEYIAQQWNVFLQNIIE